MTELFPIIAAASELPGEEERYSGRLGRQLAHTRSRLPWGLRLVVQMQFDAGLRRALRDGGSGDAVETEWGDGGLGRRGARGKEERAPAEPELVSYDDTFNYSGRTLTALGPLSPWPISSSTS